MVAVRSVAQHGRNGLIVGRDRWAERNRERALSTARTTRQRVDDQLLVGIRLALEANELVDDQRGGIDQLLAVGAANLPAASVEVGGVAGRCQPTEGFCQGVHGSTIPRPIIVECLIAPTDAPTTPQPWCGVSRGTQGRSKHSATLVWSVSWHPGTLETLHRALAAPGKRRHDGFMTRTLSDHLAAEHHLGGRAAWLRAAVLGANDGLISTASLMVGVAAANSSRSVILIAGVAGLTAGALSMAAGEYVSVSSQRDTERADIDREREELAANPKAERDELAAIYRERGLSVELADRVADELSQLDQLKIHTRDELGFDIEALANPVQASLVSATSFILGAIWPVLVVLFATAAIRVPLIIGVTLVGLGSLGSVGARLGGAPQGRAAIRVLIGGMLALLISTGIGRLTGSAL